MGVQENKQLAEFVKAGDKTSLMYACGGTITRGGKPQYAPKSRRSLNPSCSDTVGGTQSAAGSRMGFNRPTDNDLLLDAAQAR